MYQGLVQMETIEKVKKIISKQLGINLDSINLESRIEDDLGADSLDIIEIVMSLETEFEINVNDDKISRITIVKDIVDYIEQNQK